MQKGFTLIEILVVVLIIGILASVGLPQYDRAVTKARAVEFITVAESLYKAQQLFFLANGQYSVSFDGLDIEVPNSIDPSNPEKINLKFGYCRIQKTADGVAATIMCTRESKPLLVYTIRLNTGKKFCCGYKSDNYKADSFCSGLWGGGAWQNLCSSSEPCHCWLN